MRRGLGLTTDSTGAAMRRHPERLAVPNVDVDKMVRLGEHAEQIDQVLADTEFSLAILKQANLLIDKMAQDELAKVLAYVRYQEKFDKTIADLCRSSSAIVFAHTRGAEPTPQAQEKTE